MERAAAGLALCGAVVLGILSTSVTTSAAPASGLVRRFRTGIAYNLAGAVFNQGSTFAVNIVVANLLGLRVFGEYAMVQSTIATLCLIAQMGTGFTATKYVAEYRSVDPSRTGGILGMLWMVSTSTALLMALALLLLAPWLATHLLKNSNLASALMLASGVLFFSTINGFLIGALAGLEAYAAQAQALAMSGVFYMMACAAGAWLFRLNGSVGGMLISAAFQCWLLSRRLQSETAAQQIRLRLGGLGAERGIVFRFAVPSAMSGLTSVPALWLAVMFLVRQPNGYSQMGLYSAAYSLMVLVLFVPNIANNVCTSLINNERGRGNIPQYRRLFWTNAVVTGGMVAAGAVVVASVGPTLLGFFGKNFPQGSLALLILVVAAVPEMLGIAMNQLIHSLGKMWRSFFSVSLPRDLAIPVFAYLLAPAHGATGVALAYLAGRIIAFTSHTVLVWQHRHWLIAPLKHEVAAAV